MPAPPLSIRPPIIATAMPWPRRLSTSPKRSTSRACTVAPRVPLGSSATFRPLGRLLAWVRASRLAGVASKASAWATAASPL
jgi:hypothetical protein